MVITTPGWLEPTQFCDVELRTIKSLPREIRYNMSVAFHSGTSEVEAKIRLLDKERLGSGQKGWAQLKLVKPVVIAKGDRFVIRVPQGTLGGGEIIDIHPKRHRRFQPEVMQNLSVRKAGSPEDIFLVTLETDGPSKFEKLALKCHLNGNESRKLLANLMTEQRVMAAGPTGPTAVAATGK
jgi:selenocysteine-specific elongation factor